VDASLIGWCEQELAIRLDIVKRSDDLTGFHVLPRRWVIERTFGWLTHCRRLCRDYERTIAHAEDFIKIAMIRLMAARGGVDAVGVLTGPNGAARTRPGSTAAC
jgi:hypothetical protein